MYFKSFDCGPRKLFYQLIFFLLNGKDRFCEIVVLFFLLGTIFIQCEYGIGKMWMLLVNQLRNDCFDNLNNAGNLVICLFVIDQYRFVMHIYILIVVIVRLLQDKI